MPYVGPAYIHRRRLATHVGGVGKHFGLLKDVSSPLSKSRICILDGYCRCGTPTTNSNAHFPVPIPFAIRNALFKAQRGLSWVQGFNPPAQQPTSAYAKGLRYSHGVYCIDRCGLTSS